jgi:hypothetical protein
MVLGLTQHWTCLPASLHAQQSSSHVAATAWRKRCVSPVLLPDTRNVSCVQFYGSNRWRNCRILRMQQVQPRITHAETTVHGQSRTRWVSRFQKLFIRCSLRLTNVHCGVPKATTPTFQRETTLWAQFLPTAFCAARTGLVYALNWMTSHHTWRRRPVWGTGASVSKEPQSS